MVVSPAWAQVSRQQHTQLCTHMLCALAHNISRLHVYIYYVSSRVQRPLAACQGALPTAARAARVDALLMAHLMLCVHTFPPPSASAHQPNTSSPGAVLDVALSHDGVLGASCSDDLSVRVWDLEHRDCIKTCKGHTGWVVSLQVRCSWVLAGGGLCCDCCCCCCWRRHLLA